MTNYEERDERARAAAQHWLDTASAEEVAEWLAGVEEQQRLLHILSQLHTDILFDELVADWDKSS